MRTVFARFTGCEGLDLMGVWKAFNGLRTFGVSGHTACPLEARGAEMRAHATGATRGCRVEQKSLVGLSIVVPAHLSGGTASSRSVLHLGVIPRNVQALDLSSSLSVLQGLPHSDDRQGHGHCHHLGTPPCGTRQAPPHHTCPPSWPRSHIAEERKKPSARLGCSRAAE